MTSQFRVSSLRKSFGSNTIVDDLDLEIEEGEFLVLLGPSGCGKTTTLRCLAGLETPEGGSITFRDHRVFDASSRSNVPPHKRNIGMVFQSYALWPNMTVRENIRYPLKVRRMKAAMAAGAVEAAADMVDCGALLDRYPSQLSGGQQQRVAVARGLVAHPDLVLFDEPLSNLDARLRDQVRGEIHQLHQRLGFTAVFVTHDQSEALALGDRLAIMKAGRIEQYDTPQRVFESPASDYVAAFIGMANRIDLVRGHNGWMTSAGTLIDIGAAEVDGDRAVVRLRPDDVTIHRSIAEVPGTSIGFEAKLITSEYGGRYFDVTVESGGETMYLRADALEHGAWLRSLPIGHSIALSFAPPSMHVFADTSAGPAAIGHPAAALVEA